MRSDERKDDVRTVRPGEPEWLSSWRAQERDRADALPRGEKYGIDIPALELERVPTLTAYPEYSVEASKGLELYTWKEAMAQEEIAPMLERLLTSPLLPPSSSKDQALGRSEFGGGLVVYVQPSVDERGEYGEETLALATKMPLSAASDLIVVIAKEGARLSMRSAIEGGERSSVLLRTVVALIEGEAKVSLESAIPSSEGFVSIETRALVSSYSEFSYFEDPSGAAMLRSDTEVSLLGERSEGTIAHAITATGDSTLDVRARTRHVASDTSSRIYAMGTASDASRAVYRTAIDMKQGIERVKGEQEGRFLVLSDEATVDAIPALDIASSEVSSTHKLAVGHIRDEELFYARSRGVDPSLARALVLEGYFSALFEKIAKGEIMDALRARLARIAKND